MPKGLLTERETFQPISLGIGLFLQQLLWAGKAQHPAPPSGRYSWVTLGYLGVFWGNIFIFDQKSFQVSPHGEWENVGSFTNTADNSIGWEISFPGKDAVPASGWAGVPQKCHLPREAPACSSQKCLKWALSLTTSSNAGISRKEGKKLLKLL